jgi:hypothetical protein
VSAKGLFFFFSVLTAVAAAAATGGSIIRSFESPCSDCVDGLAYRSGYLYHANYNGPREILITNTTGSIVGSVDGPAGLTGVEYTGTCYWVYDHRSTVPNNVISRLDPSGSVIGSFAAPNYGYDVACDGSYLWYSTGGSHYLNYIYKLTKGGSILMSFQAPHGSGFNNRGLDWGAGSLWLAQRGARGGYIYQMTSAGSVVYSMYMPTRKPKGVAWDGAYVWFTDAATEYVYQMRWSGIGVEPASVGRVKALFR